MRFLFFCVTVTVCEFNKADFYEVILRIFRLSFHILFIFFSPPFPSSSLSIRVDYAKRAIFTSFCRVRFRVLFTKVKNPLLVFFIFLLSADTTAATKSECESTRSKYTTPKRSENFIFIVHTTTSK